MHLAVFCASRTGNNPQYQSTAHALGQLIALQGHTLVYGGSNLGYMGTVSTAALDAGGHVISVIPTIFSPEVINSQPRAETRLVSSMQERKSLMIDLCDAFVALPGGVGTLDEIFEVLMSNQLNLCDKPMGLLNVDGYFSPLLQQLDRMMQDGLLLPHSIRALKVDSTPEGLMEKINIYLENL